MTRLDVSVPAANAEAMAKMVKFSSKLDEATLDALRAHAEESGRPISALLDEAVRDYLERAAVRPAFRAATEEVLDAHAELLERLAR